MKHVWRDRKKKRASTTITKIGLSKISSNRKLKNSKTFAFIFLVQNQRGILILNAQCSEGKIIFLFFFPSRIYMVFGSVMVQLPWKAKVHATDALLGQRPPFFNCRAPILAGKALERLWW